MGPVVCVLVAGLGSGRPSGLTCSGQTAISVVCWGLKHIIGDEMNTTLKLPALSTEYVYCQVQATDVANTGNPSGNPVQFAFITDLQASPTEATEWYSGSWVEDGGPVLWTARCLVGPSGVVTFEPGTTYVIWVQIADSPETPILRAGTLTVV